MSQLKLPGVAISKEIDGIEMGVMQSGDAYLTGRGLARLCGVAPSAVIGQAINWRAGKRTGRLAQMLAEAGIDDLHVGGDSSNRGYGETSCMVFLEYYAFEAQNRTEQAYRAYRALARAGLRLFVYQALGYDPTRAVPSEWRHFHDRVALASAPIGYFSVFKEIADFVVAAIRGGLPVDDQTVPDISVGKLWARYWSDQALDGRFGPRQRHDHNYPDYFPQAASNPQEIWVYPVDALGEFRRWMQTIYIPEKLPHYLDSKVAKGALPASTAEVLIANIVAPELGTGADND